MRLVFDAVDTTISLVPAAILDEDVRSEIRETVGALDRSFSLYRPESEGSALAIGALRLAECSAELRPVFDLDLTCR